MNGYLCKDLDWKVEDIDEQHRKVLIYVSEFNSKDSDGDVIVTGAYAKTIKERGPDSFKPRIKHFRDHFDLIGKPIEMTENQKGLLVLSELSNSTKGRDAIEDYKLNLFEHSIGFEIVRKERDEQTDTQYITEAKLWEYSSVTWGANENTPLVEMKGYSKEEVLSRINNKMNSLINAIKKGNFTDEHFEALEMQLHILQKSYNDYIDSLTTPPKGTSIEPDLKWLDGAIDNFKSKING